MSGESLQGTVDLLKLHENIKSLNPADQLRLAADLVEHGKFNLAETIAGQIVDELRLLRIHKAK